MKDHMFESYLEYMSNRCTCDRSAEECPCMTYEAFCDMRFHELQEEWAQLIYETECVDVLA